MKKGNKLKSTMTLRCPCCQTGQLFEHPNPYRFKGFFTMPSACKTCGQKFQIEPGFYYGAMYVNYGLTVAIGVAVFVAMYVLGRPWELHHYLIGIGLALIALAPYSFRLARSIWIHMFVPFRQEADWPNRQTTTPKS